MKDLRSAVIVARGTKAIWQIFYGVLHNGGVKAWRGLVAWPTPCASAAAEAHTKTVKMRTISRAEGGQLQPPMRQSACQYGRNSHHSGRSMGVPEQAPVGPPPRAGVRKRLINPINHPDAVNLSKMAYIASDECRLIRQHNAGNQQIRTPNLAISLGGMQPIKLC